METIRWLGSHTCDFCGKEITDVLVDGKTSIGPWATMCSQCFKAYGVGLGVGRGQKYVADVVSSNGGFVKAED